MSNIKKPNLPAIEYIRGISMLGVIGIHIGSQYLMNPSANIHLVALFETVTRFAVPIFFFISAFGLFYHLDLNEPFDYQKFLSRRFKAVLIPYLVWSVFYMIHDYFFYGVALTIQYVIKLLFFGLAKYQLYFLVILLWFYLLMPLWIEIVRRITLKRIIILLILQVAFDYFSSYSVTLITFTYSLPNNSILRQFLLYRLNYLVLHYVFIFLLGGVLATHIDKFFRFMKQRRILITFAFIISLIALLIHYYSIIFIQHLPTEAAINTAHQLSPAGIAYTITASIFFFTIFTFNDFDDKTRTILSFFGKHSYFSYLFHPFAITYLDLLLRSTGRIMTAPIAIIFYVLVVIISLSVAVVIRNVGNKYPMINKLTIGIYQKNRQ